MCMDICSKIINTKNVFDAIEEVRERDPEMRRKKINDLLCGQVIMTRYSKRFYRITTVDFDSNPNSTFETKQGTVSFREYYLNQYQLRIKYDRQPLLISVQKEIELKLVPELCFLTGVPEFAKRNGGMMKQVRDANKSNPNDRFRAITQHTEKMNTVGKQLSEQQNFLVDPQPIQIKALELNPVRIILGNETVDCTERGFNVKSAIKAAKDINLLRIIHHSDDYNNAERLEKAMVNRMRSSGIKLKKIDYFEYSSGSQLCQHLERVRNSAEIPEILLIILKRRDKTYDEIKQIGINIDLPIQCVLSSQFGNDRKIESVLTNIAHQIAAKTGSQLWAIPSCEGIPKITMVVGMDVYHDTVNKKESILAFSASLSPEFTKYFSTIRKQAKVGEEISGAVEGCFNEALVTFFEETKRKYLPELIVVFRDGVGDSQMEIVKEIELAGLKRVISKFQGYSPQVIYTVVMKRIDQRFFLSSQGGMGNPRPGTYVTDPQVCDESTFYLITSAVNQGTATPVKYKIIENTSTVPKDVLAKFAFGLCHLYYNWKGAIKLPCPTQLSHKLAYMVGESVHKDALSRLKNSLWFL